MNVYLKGGFLITPQEDGAVSVKKRDVFVEDGKIAFSKNESLKYRTINVEGKVILPALVNPHHHIYSTLSKGLPCQVPFVDFERTLAQLWWLLDQALDSQSNILSTVLTMQDSIKNGVTTVFDHHISGNIKGALSEMGEVFENYKVNGVLCYESTNRNGEEKFNDIVKENVSFATQAKAKKGLKGMIGMHALLTLNDKNLKVLSEKTDDFPIHCHVAEGGVDEVYSLADYKKTIIQRLEDFGLLRDNSLIIHASNINEKEIDILSKKDLFIGQAIDSNMNNALAAANIKTFVDNGIKVVAGTDGMHSSAFKAMKNSFEFCKYTNQNPDVGFPEGVSLFNSSYVLKRRFGFPLGVLEDQECDIAVFDYVPATPFDESSFFGHLIFGIQEARCQYVLKGDQILLDNFILNSDLDSPYSKLINSSIDVSQKMFDRFAQLQKVSPYTVGRRYNK